MKGLLYKDYVLNNGKYYVFAVIIQIIMLVIMKIMVNDNPENEVGVVYVYALLVLVLPLCIAFILGESLLKKDSGSQIQYILSTPVNKETYIKSKYVYIIIMLAIISVISTVEYLVIKSGLEFSNSQKLMKNIGEIVPLLIAATLLIFAIELPFYFGLGVEMGQAIKTGMIFLLLFAVMAYVFFGDLDALKNMDILKLIEKLIGDKKNMIYVQIGAPIVTLGAYAGSYFISKKVLKKDLF